MKKIKVGLIVDNVERDLEGLSLVAAQLAKNGFLALLIPMYKQRFVIKSQAVDIVVLNYLRPNNLDLFMDYKRSGVKVAVLDTEGNGFRTHEELADLLLTTKMTHLVDLYMFWGSAQKRAVKAKTVALPKRVLVTGCPRYDFFAEPWFKCLQTKSQSEDFVLVNTNFPTVNPKFSGGREAEYKTMTRLGLSPTFARSTINQNETAFLGMRELVKSLATALPRQKFVLRPHPFESIDGYADLREYPNIDVIQTGSSNSWVYRSKCLIHLNCTTAIEASLLGKVILSPNWLNNTEIYRPLPNALSVLVETIDEMVSVLKSGKSMQDLKSTETDKMTKKYIHSSLHHIDGNSAKRVSAAIIRMAKEPKSIDVVPRVTFPKILKTVILNLTELPILWQIKEKCAGINKNKYFSSHDVSAILKLLVLADPMLKNVAVSDIARSSLLKQIFTDNVAVALHDNGDKQKN